MANALKDRPNIIEVTAVTEEETHNPVSFFTRIWTRLSRYVRRLVLRGKRAIMRMADRLPHGLKVSIYYAAIFVGYFMAWMLFYMSIIIAAAYGWLTLIGILIVWGLVFGYTISRLDPNYGIA